MLPDFEQHVSRYFLNIEKVSVSGQIRKFSRTTGRSLNYQTPVIEQQRAQSGKLFSAARSSQAAVQLPCPVN
jgi:hypothetical protein